MPWNFVQSQFIRREIATPLNVENTLFMGQLAAHGVDKTRIASIEYSLKPPSLKAQGEGNADKGGNDEDNEVADADDIVGIDDYEAASKQGKVGENGSGVPNGILGMMASALKETDPEEGAQLETLAHKLRGREYFLDPRMFNHHKVRRC